MAKVSNLLTIGCGCGKTYDVAVPVVGNRVRGEARCPRCGKRERIDIPAATHMASAESVDRYRSGGGRL